MSLATFMQQMGLAKAPAQPTQENQPNVENQPAPNSLETANEDKDLDFYQQLRDTAANAKPEAAPEFKLPAEELQKAVQNMDFTKGIPPELLQQAMSGDAAAFLKVLNMSNQNTFQQATNVVGQLSGEYTRQYAAHQQKSMQREFATTLATSDLNLDAHPVIKSQVLENAKLLAQQFPGANPADIKKQALDISIKQARELLKASGFDVNSTDDQNQQSPKARTAGEVDWDKEFSDM